MLCTCTKRRWWVSDFIGISCLTVHCTCVIAFLHHPTEVVQRNTMLDDISNHPQSSRRSCTWNINFTRHISHTVPWAFRWVTNVLDFFHTWLLPASVVCVFRIQQSSVEISCVKLWKIIMEDLADLQQFVLYKTIWFMENIFVPSVMGTHPSNE